MWFRKKRQKLQIDLPENIVRRANMIATQDLLGWVDTTVVSIERQVLSIRRMPEGSTEAPSRYGELVQSAEALAALTHEVVSRTGIATTLSSTPPSRAPQMGGL